MFIKLIQLLKNVEKSMFSCEMDFPICATFVRNNLDVMISGEKNPSHIKMIYKGQTVTFDVFNTEAAVT